MFKQIFFTVAAFFSEIIVLEKKTKT